MGTELSTNHRAEHVDFFNVIKCCPNVKPPLLVELMAPNGLLVDDFRPLMMLLQLDASFYGWKQINGRLMSGRSRDSGQIPVGCLAHPRF